MCNQLLVYTVSTQQLRKNPSQLILPYFCTEVQKQHFFLEELLNIYPALLKIHQAITNGLWSGDTNFRL